MKGLFICTQCTSYLLNFHIKICNKISWTLLYITLQKFSNLVKSIILDADIYNCVLFLCADVKPSNMLVNTRGQIKLCDFGVSTQVHVNLYPVTICVHVCLLAWMHILTQVLLMCMYAVSKAPINHCPISLNVYSLLYRIPPGTFCLCSLTPRYPLDCSSPLTSSSL